MVEYDYGEFKPMMSDGYISSEAAIRLIIINIRAIRTPTMARSSQGPSWEEVVCVFTGLPTVLLCDVTVDVTVVTVGVGVGCEVVVDVLVSEDGETWGLRIGASIKVDGEVSCCAELIVVAEFPLPSLDGAVDSSFISVAFADDDCDWPS